jgi:hypothetical protein
LLRVHQQILDCILNGLASTELHCLAGCDVDGFSALWISAPRARGRITDTSKGNTVPKPTFLPKAPETNQNNSLIGKALYKFESSSSSGEFANHQFLSGGARIVEKLRGRRMAIPVSISSLQSGTTLCCR